MTEQEKAERMAHALLLFAGGGPLLIDGKEYNPRNAISVALDAASDFEITSALPSEGDPERYQGPLESYPVGLS